MINFHERMGLAGIELADPGSAVRHITTVKTHNLLRYVVEVWTNEIKLMSQNVHIVLVNCLLYVRSPDKSVYLKITFLISQTKHMLWVFKRTASARPFFEYPKHMFKMVDKKIIEILPKLFLLNWPYVMCGIDSKI